MMDSYIANKIVHMQRMGIPAGIGPNGGACPSWLKELREADNKQKARRERAQLSQQLREAAE